MCIIKYNDQLIKQIKLHIFYSKILNVFSYRLHIIYDILWAKAKVCDNTH